MQNIRIAVIGPAGAGKTTLIGEIMNALTKARFTEGISVSSHDFHFTYNENHQGHRLDILAKRCRTGDLSIEIEEVTTKEDLPQDDIVF